MPPYARCWRSRSWNWSGATRGAHERFGKDVGELCELPPLGVTATDDIEAIIALNPDVVLYMPMLPDIDDMVRLLEAGINVISTAGFITGHCFGDDAMKRLHQAAERGGVSLYGSGLNPGLASVVVLTSAAACREIERISIHEAVDCTPYDSPDVASARLRVTAGHSRKLTDMMRQRISAFAGAIEMMASALRVELDEVGSRLPSAWPPSTWTSATWRSPRERCAA